MIRKLKSGKYRLYSRKKDPKTGRRRNLGTFPSLAPAKKHERAVQFFKRRCPPRRQGRGNGNGLIKKPLAKAHLKPGARPDTAQ